MTLEKFIVKNNISEEQRVSIYNFEGNIDYCGIVKNIPICFNDMEIGNAKRLKREIRIEEKA